MISLRRFRPVPFLLFLAGSVGFYASLHACAAIGVAHADPVGAVVAPQVVTGVNDPITMIFAIGAGLGLLLAGAGVILHAWQARSPGNAVIAALAKDVDLAHDKLDQLLALGRGIAGAPAPVTVSVTNHTVPSDPPASVTVTPAPVAMPIPGSGPIAALLVALLLGSLALQPACATLKADAVATEQKVAACAKADAGPVALELGALLFKASVSYASTGHVDVDALETEAEADAKTQGVTVAACAFAPVISWIEKLFPPATGTAMAALPVRDAQAALARFKAVTGLTEIRTAAGQVL